MAEFDDATPGRFRNEELMYRAARLYYEQDENQARIAQALGVSRPTVSRLLAAARRTGMVEVTVHRPAEFNDEDRLAQEVAALLGIDRVYLVLGGVGERRRSELAPGVAEALSAANLSAGEVLLVSSGMTLYTCAQQEMPSCPGVVLAPTVGGQEEPEPWYQTNVIATLFADRIGGTVSYLNAPALPNSTLRRQLLNESSYQRVSRLWSMASCALVGVGAPLSDREYLPSFVPASARSLNRAVGDVCSRFFDAEGEPVDYRGSDRLVAVTVQALRNVPVSIAVAAGLEKVPALRAGAKGGYFNQLVTDVKTARALLEGQ